MIIGIEKIKGIIKEYNKSQYKTKQKYHRWARKVVFNYVAENHSGNTWAVC